MYVVISLNFCTVHSIHAYNAYSHILREEVINNIDDHTVKARKVQANGALPGQSTDNLKSAVSYSSKPPDNISELIVQ